MTTATPSTVRPYPDGQLDEAAPVTEEPGAVVVDRETVELAFLAALQVLPPRRRAAFGLPPVLPGGGAA